MKYFAVYQKKLSKYNVMGDILRNAESLNRTTQQFNQDLPTCDVTVCVNNMIRTRVSRVNGATPACRLTVLFDTSTIQPDPSQSRTKWLAVTASASLVTNVSNTYSDRTIFCLSLSFCLLFISDQAVPSYMFVGES